MSYIHWEDFKEYADSLSVGQSGYFPHEGCTTSSKMWVVKSSSGTNAFCNKCGAKGFKCKGIWHPSMLITKASEEEKHVRNPELPDDISFDVSEWPMDAKMWLYSGDIRNKDIQEYGIGYSRSLHRVILPVYDDSFNLLMWQGRGLTEHQTKYYNERGISKNELFFKSWIKQEGEAQFNYDRVVLCEDALSVIRVGRYTPAVASLGTSMSSEQYYYLSQFDQVLVWYDEDRGGLMGSDKVIKKLSLLTDVKRIRTDEDPKKLSNKEIQEALSDI